MKQTNDTGGSKQVPVWISVELHRACAMVGEAVGLLRFQGRFPGEQEQAPSLP